MVGKKKKTGSLADLLKHPKTTGDLSSFFDDGDRVLGERKSEKRSIRFESAIQMEYIQAIVDYLNKNGEVGQRATFNSFVVDSAMKEANRIAEKINSLRNP